MQQESSYVVDGSTEPDDVEAQDQHTFSAYVDELERTSIVPSRRLFNPCAAWANEHLFGMKEFGGLGDRENGNKAWKYFAFHFLVLLTLVPENYTILYCSGASHSVSIICASVVVVPLLLLTAAAEVQIFKSPLLAMRLARGGKDVDDLKQKTTACAFFQYLVGNLVFLSATWIPVYWFLIRPYRIRTGDLIPEVVTIANVALTVVLIPFNFAFAAWSPLVKLHYKECLVAVEIATQAVERSLFSPRKVATVEARKELSSITRRLLMPLRVELRILGKEGEGALMPVIPAAIVACYLFLGQFDQVRAGEGVNVWLFRYLFGGFCLVYVLFCGTLIRDFAKPHHHWRRVWRRMEDAEMVGHALERFEGSSHALERWLKRNEVCRFLFPLFFSCF